MKITGLYVYPIKGLRGIPLETAQLGPQGIRYDRRIMLYKVRADKSLQKIQVDADPICALFETGIIEDGARGSTVVVVQYHHPPAPLPRQHNSRYGRENGIPQRVKWHSGGEDTDQKERDKEDLLEIPLEPDFATLDPIRVTLHGTSADAYHMGDRYDRWFSDRFGFETVLVYIGDGRRPVNGPSVLPPPWGERPPLLSSLSAQQPQGQEKQHRSKSGWLSTITSYVPGWAAFSPEPPAPQPWITFSDMAPYLVTSESSLADVQARLRPLMESEGRPDISDVVPQMYQFRPNIVVGGEEPWAEDFWAELAVSHSGGASTQPAFRLQLTSNCARCRSLNVDYRIGDYGKGVAGEVLKRLMSYRRVDQGQKWEPIFGRYAFLDTSSLEEGKGEVTVSVGDEVQVVDRLAERSTFVKPS
ncbi:hypothetical protein VTK73DRAFT_436 [Phialemonium thermophilum]|uniref:MOSC domain-containing protein n=1 Tax=Phialemonium thermophilum TaxID=223376 RepID=A0ABR3XEH0_9PEZI